jgi:hypothetical protein
MKTLVEQDQFRVGRTKSSNHCTTGEDLEKHVRRCVGEIKEPFDHTMCFYGVGNHGGGPTRENIESILRLNADPEFPELTFDTPDGFFERASTSGCLSRPSTTSCSTTLSAATQRTQASNASIAGPKTP